MLPFAGGSSFSFMKVTRFLDSKIEPITIEYAGRGSRKEEPFITEYNEFVFDVIRQIKKKRKIGLPFSLFGYSMGSTLAFDIASKGLLDDNLIHCFFCAEGSPVKNNPDRQYATLDTEEFIKKILQMGGINERLKANKEAFQDNLNIIYRDHCILGQYRYSGNYCDCNASIIYSEDDWTCTGMEDWKKVIKGSIDYYQMGDNHFFINQCFKDMANIVNSIIV